MSSCAPFETSDEPLSTPLTLTYATTILAPTNMQEATLSHNEFAQRSIHSSISWPEEPQWFCYVAGSTGSLSGWVALKCEKMSMCSWLLWGGTLSFGFFFLLFFSKKKMLLNFVRERCRISQTLGLQYQRNLTITQGPYLWSQTNFGPAQTRSRQDLPLVVNGVSCWVRSKRKKRVQYSQRRS